MEPPCSTAATSSRTKSGFPPERSTRSCISRPGKGFSSVASNASSAASASLSGPSSMRMTGVSSGAMKPDATSRLVRHQSHEVRCTTLAMCAKRSADASSMKWTSSIVISPD